MKPSTWTPRSLLGRETEQKQVLCSYLEIKGIEHRHQFCSLHFDKIPIFQNHTGVTLHRGEMAHAVVNRHTGWKSNSCKGWTVNEEAAKAEIPPCWMKCGKLLTFLHFFFLLENFPNFFHDVSVSLLTQAEHRGPGHCCLRNHLQGTCGQDNWNISTTIWKCMFGYYVTSFSWIETTCIIHTE